MFTGNASKEISIRNTYEYDNNNELLTEKQYKNEILQKELSYLTNKAESLLNSLVIRDHINKSIRIVKIKYDYGSLSRVKNQQ
jgi:hypothetical protein